MQNYRALIQYDGTRYSGWQKQGNTTATIQGRLEQAISGLLKEPVELHGSGRTDAGVHAVGQVANFKTAKSMDLPRFVHQLNEALPDDIAVLELTPAEPRFHARLNAKEKVYRYTIRNSHCADVFRRRFEYKLPEPLDLEKMQQAAEVLTGTHDFRGFSTGRTKKSTVRTIFSIQIDKTGGRIDITFTGDGFLYNMVRILTGTLIEIGIGTREIHSIQDVFDTKDRTRAGFTAPAQGLCLMEVRY